MKFFNLNIFNQFSKSIISFIFNQTNYIFLAAIKVPSSLLNQD